MRYQPAEIEAKWQRRWEKEGVFETPQDLSELRAKPKFYILDMFPYPSGAGLHVGHPEGYTASDILARYKRMQGFNVLHPIGWDAFGLPAERAAVRENMHPAIITKRNIDNFRRQIKRLGFSYDWNREISTASPDYYRWTQWIFSKLYEKKLAYLAEVPVNWCPALGTVLANEEVKEGKYIETGDPVQRRLMKQWMLKITAYAQRLLEDLEDLDWPEGVKEMQRNWIGRSEGATVVFQVSGSDQRFDVFTTRPDTLFGATYCVLAPEHPLVDRVASSKQRPVVEEYVARAKQKTDLARTDLAQEKTGVFLGAHAINPATNEAVPIWVADYVLMSYGTGAIMAVPAHDERDHQFARSFGLPIVSVVQGGNQPIEDEAYTGDGTLVNSDFLNGLDVSEAKVRMSQALEEKGLGAFQVQYRLRDWLFSRQRYWGEPFPIVHMEDGSVECLGEDWLPVELPDLDAFKPTSDGRPPLARASDEWLRVELSDGRVGIRETNTMPQWAGSCWYYLRYLDPKNEKAPFSKELERFWMPVDLYIGGVEHAVLHLLYARFWHKVLYDCGLVSTKEPFQGLFNQGMILAYSYRDEAGRYYPPESVVQDGKTWRSREGRVRVETQIEKMSKGKLNVVNPDEVVDQYGADALRLYEMFMGPLEDVKPWQTDGVEGVYRFLSRVWRLVVDEHTGELSKSISDAAGSSNPDLWKALHKTLKKVTEDTERLRFNTAIAQMMIFVNEATAAATVPRETIRLFIQALGPYAPHITEELWERLGETSLLCQTRWPDWDETLCQEELLTLPIMINGKKRAELQVAVDIEDQVLERLALESQRISQVLAGRKPRRVVVVSKKLVNIVV